MLQEGVAHHHIAHGDTRADPACHACEDYLRNAKQPQSAPWWWSQRPLCRYRKWPAPPARHTAAHSKKCARRARSGAVAPTHPAALAARRPRRSEWQWGRSYREALRTRNKKSGPQAALHSTTLRWLICRAIRGAGFCPPGFWATRCETPPPWVACSRSGFPCSKCAHPLRSGWGLS